MLIHLSAAWAKKQGFPIVATNLCAIGSREKVDLVAFRTSCSLMIEAKASRADFFADRKKPERRTGGVGTYRFYVTPPNLVQPAELPAGWGLLYADGKKAIEIIKPRGNHWPGLNNSFADPEWQCFQHQVDNEAERAMLFSIARRLNNNDPILLHSVA